MGRFCFAESKGLALLIPFGGGSKQNPLLTSFTCFNFSGFLRKQVFDISGKIKPSRLTRKGFALRRVRDSNPRYACAYNGFRDRPVRPLRQLSAAKIVKLNAHQNTF